MNVGDEVVVNGNKHRVIGINRCYVKLDGCTGYRHLDSLTLVESTMEKVIQALRTIDNWNRTHPTAMMIGITPYPTQDGGSEFYMNNEGFNSVDEFHSYLISYSTSEDAKASLEKTMQYLEMQRKQLE